MPCKSLQSRTVKADVCTLLPKARTRFWLGKKKRAAVSKANATIQIQTSAKAAHVLLQISQLPNCSQRIISNPPKSIKLLANLVKMLCTYLQDRCELF